jgi:hypothetical protein
MASVLFTGKDTFASTTAGYRMGIDFSTDTYKWVIGDSANHIDWNVTTANTLTITGALSASTITGGVLQTSTSGYRIRIVDTDPGTPNQGDNTLAVIDDSNRVVLRLGGDNAAGAMIKTDLYTARGGLEINVPSDYNGTRTLPIVDITIDETSTTTNSTLVDLNNYGNGTRSTLRINTGDGSGSRPECSSLEINHDTYDASADVAVFTIDKSSSTGRGLVIDYTGFGAVADFTNNSTSTSNNSPVLKLTQDRIISVSGTNFRFNGLFGGIAHFQGNGTPNGLLNAGTYGGSRGSVCHDTNDGNIYRNTDGGTTWTAM